MLSELTPYSHDPVRGRLAPKLARLMEAAGADHCTLVWRDAAHPTEFHPYLTLGVGGAAKLRDLPLELEQTARRESVTGRLRSGQTRANKCAGMFVAEHGDRSWLLVLQSRDRLGVGREVGREVEVALWGAIWAVTRPRHLEPTGRLDARDLLSEAEAAEDESAFEDALRRYDRAHEVSLATGDSEGVILSSWYKGRALRKLARWDEAMSWYTRAREMAIGAGNPGLVASATVGLANVRLHKGALAEARDLYQEAVRVGQEAGNEQAVAQGYFGLMWVHGEEQDWPSATRVGWQAYTAARGLPDEWDILVALGGCFRMSGRMDEARSCNLVAMHAAPMPETRQLATCNLAVISALEGDEQSYEGFSAQIDADKMSARGRVEVLMERGQALCALGRDDEGRQALRTALRQAEDLKFGKLVFDIECSLELDSPWEPLVGPNPTLRDAEDVEIRTQLELMASEV